MKFTRTLVVAALCLAVVHSVPVPSEESFKSQALDRLMVAESENDEALRNKRTIGILRQLFPDISKDVNPESENHLSELGGSESQNNEVRVQFDDEPNQVASEATEPELTPLDDIEETGDDENRNKRFLNFGFGASSGGGSGSSAGSGNFLFDIIRQAADGAARAAGTVYRVVAGTQSLGLGLSASRDVGPAAPSAFAAPFAAAQAAPGGAASPQPPLVAGSGGASSGGEHNGGGAPAAPAATEAVPGPVTRLFVIANRGISNLIQDLILRLAATSERIVNFKARLITSII